jgi:hypothetical protein
VPTARLCFVLIVVIATSTFGSVPTHREFARGATAGMVGGVLDSDRFEVSDTVAVSVQGSHRFSWLLRDGAVDALRARGRTAVLDSVAETTLALRLSHLELSYPKARREGFLRERMLTRRVDIRFDLRVVSERGVVLFDTVVADGRSDLLSASLVSSLSDPTAGLTPQLPESSWERLWQPTLVVGAVATLIYLFYANR